MTMFSSYSNPVNASACGAEASFSCAHTARLALDAVLASIFAICLLLVGVCLLPALLVLVSLITLIGLITLLALRTTSSPKDRALC